MRSTHYMQKHFSCSNREDGTCLKLYRLNLSMLESFLTWLLKVTDESRMIRDVFYQFKLLTSQKKVGGFSWSFCEKHAHRFFVFRRRHELLSQSCMRVISAVRMQAASVMFLAGVKMTASSVYICIWMFLHADGSYWYTEKRELVPVWTLEGPLLDKVRKRFDTMNRHIVC